MMMMMVTLDQSGALLGPRCRPSIVSSVCRSTGWGGTDHGEPDVLGEKCVRKYQKVGIYDEPLTIDIFRVFSLPPELLKKEEKAAVEISDDSDDDGEEKIGFVQHLSATKRWGPETV